MQRGIGGHRARLTARTTQEAGAYRLHCVAALESRARNLEISAQLP